MEPPLSTAPLPNELIDIDVSNLNDEQLAQIVNEDLPRLRGYLQKGDKPGLQVAMKARLAEIRSCREDAAAVEDPAESILFSRSH